MTKDELFPFVGVERQGDRWVQTGRPSVRLGYHLPDGNGMDDGLFAEWDWDGETLEARVDWLGVHPLFYAYEGNRVLVASSVVRLLEEGVSAELDASALSVFFRLGFFLGEDTPFRAIRAFPPGGVLRFGPAGFSLCEHYPQVGLDPVAEGKEGEAYIDLFRNAIARRKDLLGDFAQPVSGGRDSRHILAELVRQGSPPKFAYTIETLGRGSRYGEEETAVAVCSALGVEHRVIRHPIRSEVGRESLKNFLTHFSSDEGSWILGALGLLQSHPGGFFDGFLGDVLAAYHWPTAFLDENSSQGLSAGELIDRILQRFHRRPWPVQECMQAHLGSEHDFSLDACRERFQEAIRKFEGSHNPITQFFLFSRGRREIAVSTWGSYPFVEKILAPFLDRDFVSFYLAQPERSEVPYAWRRSEAIAKAYPELAAIPYAKPSHVDRLTLLKRRMGMLGKLFGSSKSHLGVSKTAFRSWYAERLLRGSAKTPDFARFLFAEQIKSFRDGRIDQPIDTMMEILERVRGGGVLSTRR